MSNHYFLKIRLKEILIVEAGRGRGFCIWQGLLFSTFWCFKNRNEPIYIYMYDFHNAPSIHFLRYEEHNVLKNNFVEFKFSKLLTSLYLKLLLTLKTQFMGFKMN